MRKIVLLAGMLALPFLAGCATGEDPQAAAAARQDHLTQDVNACAAKRKPGSATDHVDYALCVNSAFVAGMVEAKYSYADIVATLSAERLRVAEQLDQNKISSTEGLARLNDKITEVVRLDQVRSRSVDKRGESIPPQYFLIWLQSGV